MSETVFFTICARNYLPAAVTLGKSVKQTHSDVRFVIWILDEKRPPRLPDEIESMSIVDCMTPSEWRKLVLQYDILEYATAVKPWVFLYHFSERYNNLIYLDPDIFVYRPFTHVLRLLNTGSKAVLTPHITEPLPRDGKLPSDLDILKSGVYNLGFLALRRSSETIEFVNWWRSWLKSHCFADPRTGVFTDQKWMEFAPVFLPQTTILRHKGYNVAYWNLAQRSIQKSEEGWMVDHEPLVFFHFSGFNPKSIADLSKHQTRIHLNDKDPVYELCTEYVANVETMGASYFEEWAPHSFQFANGVEFDRVCKKAYADARAQGLDFADLFGTEEGSFYRWLNEPVPDDRGEAPYVTRYLRTLYDLREDVQKAFPDLLGADRQGFLTWARKNAPKEMGIDTAFLDEAERRRVPSYSKLIYVGYLRSEMGLGEAARGYVRALRSCGVDLTLVDVSLLAPHRAQDDSIDSVLMSWPKTSEASINVFHINADELPHVREYLNITPKPRCYNIGIWAWETQNFPRKWKDRFTMVDEIWAASTFMVESISKLSPIPVICVPHVVSIPDVRADKSQFGLNEGEFVFLFHFDFLSFSERKNPEGVISAFRKAFKPDESVRLVIKSINADRQPQKLRELQELAGESRVTFINETLDSEMRYQLIQCCDAYVSLHRAEGFGLGIAEAMAMGKPVVATGWSGNMDYMNVANSLPVRYHLKPLKSDIGPYQAGSLWAEPDIDHAAKLMRDLFESRDLCVSIGERARNDVKNLLSEESVGKRIKERLERIGEMIEEEMRSTSNQWSAPSIPSSSIHWAERYTRMFWLRTRNVFPPNIQKHISRCGTSILRALHLME